VLRRAAALALALATVTTTGGCGVKKSAGAGPAVSASAAPPVTARRPTRRYYLSRTGDRCEVYSVDKDEFSEPQKTPCPQELEPGERFRITGRTCIRESTDPLREVPVVCPDPLTNLEKHDRKKAE
jgi:hypothetical protein